MLNFIQRSVTSLQDNIYYAALLALLAVLSIILLGYEFISSADREMIIIFQQIDIIIAIIFLTDFLAGMLFNTSMNMKTYVSKNWLNLISSIPITSELTRALRILRIVRALRVIRVGMNFWFTKNRFRKSVEKN